MSLVVRNLSEQIYEIVRERILAGDLAPGAPVRQDSLAADLGVSKIPLREALSRLEQDGLLTSYPNRGYVVRPLSTEEATEIFQLRLQLEPQAAAAACKLANAAQQQEASARLASFEADQEREGADRAGGNRAFHLSLVKPGGAVVYQLIEWLMVQAERYVRVQIEQSADRVVRASVEHRELLAAWTERDAAKVERVLDMHIRATLADLQNQLVTATPPQGS